MLAHTDPVAERIHGVADGLGRLLSEAQAARRARGEVSGCPEAGAREEGRCEDGATFYNWNNRPR